MSETASGNPAASDARLLIRASAGSGKTYQLSTRYVAALQKSTPDRILATTFTRKAAGEILQRVLTRLAGAVLDPEKRKELATALERPELSAGESRELLLRVVRSLHRVRIATLDSFFAQVARAFALELGLPANWRVLDEGLGDELQRRAIQDVVETGGISDIRRLAYLLAKGEHRRNVNALILDAISTHYDLYRLAGRDAWSLEVPPGLLTNDEVEAAIQNLEATATPDLRLWNLARDAAVAAASAHNWSEFVRRGLPKNILEGRARFGNRDISDELLAAYRPLLRHAVAFETRVLADQNEATRDLLERFEECFDRVKRDAGMLTFSDVTHRIAEVLSEDAADHLSYRLDARVDHLLLDEFQDTSPEQWQVLRPIARGVSASDQATFFCVGDVKQAIYGWRGGVAAIFDAVATEVPGVAQQPLNESYRSAPAVIESVNRVFTSLGSCPDLGDDAPAVQEFSRQFPRHSTVRQEAAGYVCLQTAYAADADESARDAVLRFAADRIQELSERLPPEVTVGVLLRTNASAGRLIYELRKRGVPASEEGGNAVTDSAAVQLVLSALQFADHPGDTVARFHVAHSPLASILELTPGTDDATAQELAADVRRDVLERGYGDVIYDWMLALHPYCDERELTRLRQLVGLADEFRPFASLRPSEFVRYVERRRVEDPRTAQVRVMTIHRSKGLEFDVVVLPELDGRLYQNMQVATLRNADAPTEPPVLISRPSNQQLRALLPAALTDAVRQTRDRMVVEALCLLYVAMTRAAHALYMYVSPEPHFKLTSARLLQHAFDAPEILQPDDVLYQHGDPDWFRTLAVETEAAHPPPTPEPIRVELAAMEGGPRRGLEPVAPSRHQDAARRVVRIGSVLSPQRPEALRAGTIIHAWFETIEWLEDGLPEEEQLLRIARRLGATPEQSRRHLERFRSALEQPAIRELLSRAGYQDRLPHSDDVRAGGEAPTVTVRNECPIATLEDGLFVAGTIDRLVVFSVGGRIQAAEVIDYKTDPVEPNRTGDLVRRYGDQLRAYADAVACMYDLPRERIAMRLVSLSAGRVLEVPVEAAVDVEPAVAGSQLRLF